MAPMKRKATFAKRAAKRNRASKDVPMVVNALARSEALPENLRNTLKAALPIVLGANKADRHKFEEEVVAEAQKGLKGVQAALEQEHKAALEAQNAVIAPAERARRVAAVQEAEAHLKSMKAKGEEDKAAKKAAEKATEDAEDALRAAQSEEKAAEKKLANVANKQAHVTNVLSNEFVACQDGTSAGAAGRNAVQSLVAVGKEFGLDSTLLATLPITCKKQADARTEFETMMFANLKGLMESVIKDLGQQVAQAEPVRNEKAAAATAAKQALENARAAEQQASEQLATTQAATSAANKEVHKADAHRRQIWADMRHACEKQDSLANSVAHLKTDIWGAFEKLKEKAPEPEPVAEPEPAAEADATMHAEGEAGGSA